MGAALGPYSTASYRRPLVGGAAACVLSPTPVQIRTTLLPPPSGEVSSAVPREADDGGGRPGAHPPASYRRPLVSGAAVCVLSPTPGKSAPHSCLPHRGEVSSAVPREADDGGGASLLAPARSAPSAGRPRTPSLRRNRGLLRRGDPRGRPAPGLIKSRRTTAAVRLSFSSYYHSSQQIILPHELDPLPADLQRSSRVGLLA